MTTEEIKKKYDWLSDKYVMACRHRPVDIPDLVRINDLLKELDRELAECDLAVEAKTETVPEAIES